MTREKPDTGESDSQLPDFLRHKSIPHCVTCDTRIPPNSPNSERPLCNLSFAPEADPHSVESSSVSSSLQAHLRSFDRVMRHQFSYSSLIIKSVLVVIGTFLLGVVLLFHPRLPTMVNILLFSAWFRILGAVLLLFSAFTLASTMRTVIASLA